MLPTPRTRAQQRLAQQPGTPPPPPLARTATADRSSVWLGALCQRCGKPITATARLDPRAGDAQVIGQEVWRHVVTGEPGCLPR